MVRRTSMRRQGLSIAMSLFVLACAELAGFENLSPRKLEEQAGSGGIAGDAVSGGSKSASGGASAGVSEGGSPHDAGGNVNVGNVGGASPSGGVSTMAGAGGAVGGGANGGTAGNAGAGGTELVGGCNAQQLKNADFDRGPLDWTQESTAPGILGVDDIILERNNERLTMTQVSPRSGNYLAWLGGRPNSDKSTRVNLLQPVQIPSKVSGLVVSGWIRIRTAEPTVEDSNDLLDVALQDEDDFWTFHVWYVDAATDEWQPFEYRADNPSLLDTLRGRTVTFIVESKTDTTHETHFWVDSLSFVAECP